MKKELIPEPNRLVAPDINVRPNRPGPRHLFSKKLLTELFYVPRRFLEMVLIEVLTPEEKGRLSRYLFNVFPKAPGHAVPFWGETLAPWEETWFRRRLPAPPARVLLGACGAGREVVALTKEGFHVDAFDPAPNLVSSTKAAVGNKARILTFGYEELSAAVLDNTSGLASSLEKYYDAVLLGWGSLTCLMDPTERTRLIRAIDLLCPKGPILASFWCTNGFSPRKPTRRRTERLGQALGVALAKLRGVRSEASSQEYFLAHSGFGHVFAPEEIEQLGATIRRTVIWDSDDTDYSHVTFVPQ
jgi:hypothetical protein